MKLWNTSEKVEGYIAFFGLQEWWFSSFTEDERVYIDDRYQPMGRPPHTLTRGKMNTSKPASTFLNELNTWFRSKKDLSIAEKIHTELVNQGKEHPVYSPGYYAGRHFSTYVRDVETYKNVGQLDKAENLLLELIATTEAESAIDGQGVAPWYYDELAKLYRKQKRLSDEISILERYARKKHAPGVTPKKLLERLEKARKSVAE